MTLDSLEDPCGSFQLSSFRQEHLRLSRGLRKRAKNATRVSVPLFSRACARKHKERYYMRSVLAWCQGGLYTAAVGNDSMLQLLLRLGADIGNSEVVVAEAEKGGHIFTAKYVRALRLDASSERIYQKW